MAFSRLRQDGRGGGLPLGNGGDGEPNRELGSGLSHVNANVLKVKLATAIIGISSIHLLKSFINAPNMDDKTLLWQTVIHMAFIFSAVSIAYIDKMMSHPPPSPKGNS